MMKGPGGWSVESLHGGALLDRESRKTVKQIDVEIKNVSCLQSLSPCSVWFFFLGFLVWYGSFQWPIHSNTRSTSFDSIEIAAQNLMVRKSLMKVSRRRLKLLKCQRWLSNSVSRRPKGCWQLHIDYSKRLCYFFSFYSISSSTRKALFFIPSKPSSNS